MKISVIIPVKNGAATLQRCLQSIKKQQTLHEVEIIIIDSASTDESREIAQHEGARVITIQAEEFNHGLTRNRGVKEALGELVFLTVQDAWLSSSNTFERMTSHFSNPDVMGVVGHQAIPAEKDKNPLLWVKRYTEPTVMVRHLQPSYTLSALPVQQQKELIAWDNVVAMYRKSALDELPFDKTDFAEDWIWSKKALEKCWKLVYDPSLVVYHYHHRTFKYVFNVTYTLHYHFHQHFDFLPSLKFDFLRNARAVYHLSKHSHLRTTEKLYWIFHNIKANTAEALSIVAFRLLMSLGSKEALKKGYLFFCTSIPQGKQKQPG